MAHFASILAFALMLAASADPQCGNCTSCMQSDGRCLQTVQYNCSSSDNEVWCGDSATPDGRRRRKGDSRRRQKGVSERRRKGNGQRRRKEDSQRRRRRKVTTAPNTTTPPVFETTMPPPAGIRRRRKWVISGGPGRRRQAVTCDSCNTCLWDNQHCVKFIRKRFCRSWSDATWCPDLQPTTSALRGATSATTTSAPALLSTAPPSLKPDPCNVNLFNATVSHQNLLGLGPDSGADNIRYSKVGSVKTESGSSTQTTFFDLIIRGAGYNVNEILLHQNSYAELSLQAPSNLSLTFSFEDSETGTPVVIESFRLTVLDIDESIYARERIVLGGFESYLLDRETEVDVRPLASGETQLLSTQMGFECDNPRDPDPFKLGEVTCQQGNQEPYTVDQRRRLATFLFLDRSSFRMNLEALLQKPCVNEPCGIRNFVFDVQC